MKSTEKRQARKHLVQVLALLMAAPALSTAAEQTARKDRIEAVLASGNGGAAMTVSAPAGFLVRRGSDGAVLSPNKRSQSDDVTLLRDQGNGEVTLNYAYLTEAANDLGAIGYLRLQSRSIPNEIENGYDRERSQQFVVFKMTGISDAPEVRGKTCITFMRAVRVPMSKTGALLSSSLCGEAAAIKSAPARYEQQARASFDDWVNQHRMGK